MRLRGCVVVGGAGAVGAMVAALLARSGADVTVVDTRPAPATPAGYLRGDVTHLDAPLAAALGAADLVVLAVPEPVAAAAVAGVAGAMRRGAVLADTLSVKSPFVAALRGLPAGVEAVSLNPMFAPALGIAGRPVAAVVVRDGPGVRELLRLVGQWGGRVRLLGADEHDRLTGTAQALTHAAVLGFGFALTGLSADTAALRAIAPPPYTLLLALLARIASGVPGVYWGVQEANPYAAPARAALAGGLRRLAALVEAGDEAGFAGALGEVRDLLGPHLPDYRTLCAGAIEAMSTVDGGGTP